VAAAQAQAGLNESQPNKTRALAHRSKHTLKQEASRKQKAAEAVSSYFTVVVFIMIDDAPTDSVGPVR
jgi:hypothetical protein